MRSSLSTIAIQSAVTSSSPRFRAAAGPRLTFWLTIVIRGSPAATRSAMATLSSLDASSMTINSQELRVCRMTD